MKIKRARERNSTHIHSVHKIYSMCTVQTVTSISKCRKIAKKNNTYTLYNEREERKKWFEVKFRREKKMMNTSDWGSKLFDIAKYLKFLRNKIEREYNLKRGREKEKETKWYELWTKWFQIKIIERFFFWTNIDRSFEDTGGLLTKKKIEKRLIKMAFLIVSKLKPNTPSKCE